MSSDQFRGGRQATPIYELVAHPHRSEKLTECTSDDSCRGTADSEMFRNQSCPRYPFIFLQPSSPIEAHTIMSSRASSSKRRI
ncbi:hypothetical protein ACTXT7_016890 [Hymenolepis weldensis]